MYSCCLDSFIVSQIFSFLLFSKGKYTVGREFPPPPDDSHNYVPWLFKRASWWEISISDICALALLKQIIHDRIWRILSVYGAICWEVLVHMIYWNEQEGHLLGLEKVEKKHWLPLHPTPACLPIFTFGWLPFMYPSVLPPCNSPLTICLSIPIPSCLTTLPVCQTEWGKQLDRVRQAKPVAASPNATWRTLVSGKASVVTMSGNFIHLEGLCP